MTENTSAAVNGDVNAAVFSERLRVSAILESVEGKRNPSIASDLALRSSLDVEAARAVLAKLPAENPYLAAMNREGPIGMAPTVAEFATDPKAARLKEIEGSVKAYNEARGFKSKD